MFSLLVVNTEELQNLLTMPDVSKHAAVLQDLKNGSIRTLGVSIGLVTITPGQKIAKAGKKKDELYLLSWVYLTIAHQKLTKHPNSRHHRTCQKIRHTR